MTARVPPRALATARSLAAGFAALIATAAIPHAGRAQDAPRIEPREASRIAAAASGPVLAPAGIARSRAASGVDATGTAPAGRTPASPFTPRDITHHDWWIPAASAVLPGAGQARLGQDRFVGYMAVEGFLWVRYLTDRRAGIDARNAYRDMALRVSRAAFPGEKPTGNFEYYERMEHWIASGVYDGDPGAGFAPEVDTTTFNGKMWSIARKTYWSDPKTPPPIGSAPYEAALRFYRQNAVTPEFQWSWRNAPLHQDVYRRNVRASNDGFRHAAQDIGAVIANHVLSTVDAYISLRLRLGESTDTGTSSLGIGATLPFATIDRIVNGSPRNERTQ
jgi:hypothetical protein